MTAAEAELALMEMEDEDAAAASPAREKTGFLAALGKGAGQGVTLGFGDEINGLIQAAGEGIQNPGGKQGFWDRYRKNRDTFRAEDARAEEDQGEAFLAGNVAGGAALMPLGGPLTRFAAKAAPGAVSALSGGGALRQAIQLGGGLGAATGLGSSEADVTRGGLGQAAFDTGLGGAVGAGAGLLGHGIQKGASGLGGWLANKGAKRLAAAEAKAAQMADDAVTAENLSLRSKAGTTAQAAYKNMDRLRELNALGLLNPKQKAVYDELSEEIGDKAAESIIPDAMTKWSAKEALREATETAAQRKAAKAAELLKPSVGSDAKSFFKAYGEPLAMSAAGGAIGNEFDAPWLGTGAGLVFGRTRAGKALANRVMRPGNQASLAHALHKLGSGLSRVAPKAGTLEALAGRSPTAIGGIQEVPVLAELFEDEEEPKSFTQALKRRRGR